MKQCQELEREKPCCEILSNHRLTINIEKITINLIFIKKNEFPKVASGYSYNYLV